MKRKIIIDCDPGIDDSLAIMMALTSKEVESFRNYDRMWKCACTDGI